MLESSNKGFSALYMVNTLFFHVRNIFVSLRVPLCFSWLRGEFKHPYKSFQLLLLLLLLGGCQVKSEVLEPRVNYSVSSNDVAGFPTAFPPLTSQEASQDWGKELRIGEMFGRELDFYRAIGTWKRALVLLPSEEKGRRMQIEYDIIQAYFLAGKYGDVVTTFEQSSLVHVGPTFPAFGDLLVMLYEAYLETGQESNADKLMLLIKSGNAAIGEKLQLGKAIQHGDLKALHQHFCNNQTPTADFLYTYISQAKSVKKAQLLNAIFPGAGYAYVGQKKTGLTSFLINTLFFAATWRLAEHGHIAAACITGGLEMGWYIGGINGAGLAAKEYNQVLYEVLAGQQMRKQQLFPLLMVETRF